MKTKVPILSLTKAFFRLLVRRLCGLIVMPFLYARYSFVFFAPILFIDGVTYELFFVICFIYALFFGIIMGNFGVMHHCTKLFQWIFKVKYDTPRQWASEMLHSYSVWSYPILRVREKEYKLKIGIMGGNLYENEDNIRRKAIVYWLLG
jgi:hypothetical protein